MTISKTKETRMKTVMLDRDGGKIAYDVQGQARW